MTEEEAKDKWCPMVRFHNGLDGNVYCSKPGGVATDDSAKCIAFDCMMWESEHELESKQTVRGEDIPKGWHIISNDIDYKQTIGRNIKIASGDCGLKTKESGCFYPG